MDNYVSFDQWAVIRARVLQRGQPVDELRVLGGWFKDWKLSSGVIKVDTDEDVFRFTSSSGTIHICPKDGYGISSVMNSGLQAALGLPQVLALDPLEDQDWSQIKL